MLLTPLVSAFRRLRSEEHGAGLAAVIGLLAVSLLTTSLVASSVVSATEYTSVTRAGVQSQAAAEAGIAVARAGLLAGTCAANGNVYASAAGAVPKYVATIWLPSGSSWVRGCPSGLATQVRILSTGYAKAVGAAQANARNTTNAEIVLSSASVPTNIAATGPAVYAYNSSGFGGGGKLVSVDGSSASILISQGDVNCTGGASGQADIVVKNGNLTVSAGCLISGNAWASGTVTLPGGPSIGGNVVGNQLVISGGSKIGGNAWITTSASFDGGAEVTGNLTAASATFNGGKVGGNAQFTGAVTFTGGGPTLNGNLSAASLTTSNGGTVVKNAWIRGATSMTWGALIQGNLTTKSYSYPAYSNLVNGTVTIVPGGPTTSPYATNSAKPATPTVPDWYDFTYVAADWTGFATATMSGSNCTYAQLLAAVNSFAGQAGVVNALGCTNGIVIGGADKIAVNSDLAIFANKFDLGGGGGFTNTTPTKRLWLISPDTVKDTTPTCTQGDSSFSVNGGFTFATPGLTVMMYTPCKIVLTSSTKFNGQVFSGKAGIDGGAQLGYTAVGLPGVDLNTGLGTTTSSTEADRTIVSYRNVTVGN
ncbi:MAG: hypothetical protein ABI435_06510 [Pseudolysinimonas sp.]